MFWGVLIVWQIPWTGDEAYDKNLRLQMGRCPVRSVAEEALKVLVKNHDKFRCVISLAQRSIC